MRRISTAKRLLAWGASVVLLATAGAIVWYTLNDERRVGPPAARETQDREMLARDPGDAAPDGTADGATPAPARTPLPNLTVVTLAPTASAAEVGGTFITEVVLANRGDGAVVGLDRFDVEFVLSSDARAPVAPASADARWHEDALLGGGRADTSPAYDAGEREHWFQTLTVPPGWTAGRFQLCAVIDPGQRVDESDEHDNVACTPLEVRTSTAGPAAGVAEDSAARQS